MNSRTETKNDRDQQEGSIGVFIGGFPSDSTEGKSKFLTFRGAAPVLFQLRFIDRSQNRPEQERHEQGLRLLVLQSARGRGQGDRRAAQTPGEDGKPKANW